MLTQRPDPLPAAVDVSPAMPRPSVAWYGVAVLFVVQIFSFVDRQALSLLIAPIKADLGMSDTEVSLVIGLGFALAYAVAGLPIGRLVDRVSRPALLSAGLALWCGCTFLCGFVRSFPQLALARSGVGIGEATGTPVVVSLLGDWFPPHRRGLAFAVFAVSAYVGTGLALVAGSGIVHAFEGLTVVDVPLIGSVRTWQFVFLLIGPPGLLVIPFVLSLYEPRRSGVAKGQGKPTSDAPDLPQVVAHYRRHWRAFATQHAASTLLAMLFYGTGAWVPEFLRRTYGLPIAQGGLWFGCVTVAAGALGVLAGGVTSDRMLRAGRTDARLRVTGIAALCALPFAAAFPQAATPALALLLAGGMIFFTAVISTTGSTGVQELAPARMRGTASAVYLFVFNGIGLSLGPTVFALLTDRAFGDEALLWRAMAVGAPSLAILAALAAFSGLHPYRACVAANAGTSGAHEAAPSTSPASPASTRIATA
ncbi:MFS transporter [Methylobacterium nodulans]|uniref:Major facilitator superfamily MFS_1 n=1 Tax=Methylobacterium nodulans (strain LMG 21967 / CNCM I-2342 / ORS 2060) TaxID=460265 RepID=B8IVK6_METNO|nr:MFS transporter [Methylobacterium nodulans]ACL62446.1 major facilitator superfamily MFS_1 [Methylobacterium nodulans ORS 2060]